MADCEHRPNEDHMTCAECGQCREDLGQDDVCCDCAEDDAPLSCYACGGALDLELQAHVSTADNPGLILTPDMFGVVAATCVECGLLVYEDDEHPMDTAAFAAGKYRGDLA